MDEVFEEKHFRPSRRTLCARMLNVDENYDSSTAGVDQNLTTRFSEVFHTDHPTPL